MAKMNYNEVMYILNDEYNTEMAAAKVTKELMKKTLNPFKRISYKKQYSILIDHAIGIKLAISRIKRNIEEP